MSTKYLKNRKYNEGSQLKSVATWGYWEGHGTYGLGTKREGAPFFEALTGKHLTLNSPSLIPYQFFELTPL